MNKLIGIVVAFSLIVPFVASADSLVTATAGVGATVSPAGIVVVPTGITQSFFPGAFTGFTLSDVSVDGVSQGAVGSVDIVGDLSTHTVDVSATSNAVASGSGMIWGSSPLAPGWNVNLPDGGFGGTSHFVKYDGTTCLFNQGCEVQN